MTNDYHWMLGWVKNQLTAFTILFFSGLLLSLILFLVFLKIGAFQTESDFIYWSIIVVTTVGPQIGLYYKWIVPIPPQYEVEVVIFNERQGYWLKEGLYLIPFYGWFIKLNKPKIFKTSREGDTRNFVYFAQDKYGEVLEVRTDAERKIKNPTKYEEFDTKHMEIDERELLKNAGIRKILQLGFKDDIAGKTISIKDNDYIQKCNYFGIDFDPIILTIRIADPGPDSLLAKWNRLVAKLTANYKESTGKNELNKDDMVEIHDQAELMLKMNVGKEIFEGLGESKPIVSVGKK